MKENAKVLNSCTLVFKNILMVKKVGRRTVNYDKIRKEGLERKIREK